MARKLLGVVPLLAAIWCLSYPAPGVWMLSKNDLGQKFRETMGYIQGGDVKAAAKSGRSLLDSRELPAGLAEFVRRKTGKSHIEKGGAAWEALFQQAGGKRGEYLYLPADTEPLSAWVDSGRSFYNVELPGKSPVFLLVQLYSTHSAMFKSEIPWSMTHPYASLSPWLAGIGIFFYIFLPWYRRRDNEATYSRLRSVIGPDIVGLLLTGVFMVLPLFIITQISEHPRPLDINSGDAWFCFMFWFIAAIGASSFIISVWYEGLRFVITPEGITKISLRGSREFAFSQMIEVRPIHMALPRWLKAIAWLIVIFNWRLAGPLLLGAHSTNHGLEVSCRDGRPLKIWAVHLLGYEEIGKALKEAGVTFQEPKNEEPAK